VLLLLNKIVHMWVREKTFGTYFAISNCGWRIRNEIGNHSSNDKISSDTHINWVQGEKNSSESCGIRNCW
jgi:hypothetical protein